MISIETDEVFEPSPANRGRFAVKVLLAVIFSVVSLNVWFDSDWQPMPQILLPCFAVVGLRNLHSLWSPPYIRLSHRGVDLRTWGYLGAGGTVRWSSLVESILLPFRRYKRYEVPWEQLVSIEAFKHTINGFTITHHLTIVYRVSDSKPQSVVIPREVFSLTPMDLNIAINAFRDLEFRWKPLRDSGALAAWAHTQRERFKNPLQIRYRLSRQFLSLAVLGLLILTSTISAIASGIIHISSALNIWVFGTNLLAFLFMIVGVSELSGWVAIGKLRTITLASDGIVLGRIDAPAAKYSWANVVSARLRNVEHQHISAGLCTEGLDVWIANGNRLFLPNSYDFSLSELESILTPFETISSQATK